MRVKLLILILLLSVAAFYGNTCTGQQIFAKTYGQFDFNMGKDIIIDGSNYYVLANSGLNNSSSAPMILRIDSIGHVLKIGYSNSAGIMSASRFVKKGNKIYACGTIQNTLSNDYDCFLTLFDTSLVTEKTTIFGGNSWDFAHCIAVSDTLIFVGGKSFSTTNGFACGIISKFNTNGDSLATYYFGLNGEASIKSLIIRGDTELIYTGSYQAPDSTVSSAFVTSANFNGALNWSKNLSADLGKSIGSDLTKGLNDKIAICGTTEIDEATSMKDAFVYVLQSNGNYDNHLIYGTNCPDDEIFTSITTTDEGDYFLCGNTKCIGAGANDVYLFKTNAGGWWMWSTSYGQENEDYASRICYQPLDSGFVMVGSSIDYGNFNTNILVVKTDKSLSLQYNPTHEVSIARYSNNVGLSVFPNPAYDLVHIQGDVESILAIEILDISGRILAQINKDNIVNNAFSVSQFASQILLIKIKSLKGMQTVKIVKQ